MTVLVALDTSVAVPLLVKRHRAHAAVVEWWGNRDVVLCGHACIETYSVLTRLPDGLRLLPDDVVRLFAARFAPPLLLAARTARRVPQILAANGIAGGAVYDALVGLAASEHGCVLATRDARAKATYDSLDVRVEVVG